ncbi:oligosaccharyl transferase glycoprotein complex, beta subunit [Savitreella phatthalungensis]
MASRAPNLVRRLATAAKLPKQHDILIIGGGTAGINIANQLGQAYRLHDAQVPRISIVDGADTHHYQPGWTLVGAGLADKTELNRKLSDIVPDGVSLVSSHVASIDAEQNIVQTSDGQTHAYSHLIVCPGIRSNPAGVPGLAEALETEFVGTIYDYRYCDKVWNNITGFEKGNAVFTHPAGDVKCAGAPQKLMWMAEDHWRRQGRRQDISVEFHTALPQMFGVNKYSDILRGQADSRDVKPNFKSVLREVDAKSRVAFFQQDGDKVIERKYDFLHAVPPMAPHAFVKDSAVANPAGFVDVDKETLRSTKFANVWSLGDASSLPTSKTAAAVMSQAPILAHNFYLANERNADLATDSSAAKYDGYTSCPLLTSYGGLLLAEFGYGGEVKETFAKYGLSQDAPSRWAFHLKKDIFPRVYFGPFLNGGWYGRHGLVRPQFD